MLAVLLLCIAAGQARQLKQTRESYTLQCLSDCSYQPIYIWKLGELAILLRIAFLERTFHQYTYLFPLKV